MEKKITYKELNDLLISQVKNGQRVILTSDRGDTIALVSLDDLEIVKEFERIEDEIDREAVTNALEEETVDWEDFKG